MQRKIRILLAIAFAFAIAFVTSTPAHASAGQSGSRCHTASGTYWNEWVTTTWYYDIQKYKPTQVAYTGDYVITHMHVEWWRQNTKMETADFYDNNRTQTHNWSTYYYALLSQASQGGVKYDLTTFGGIHVYCTTNW